MNLVDTVRSVRVLGFAFADFFAVYLVARWLSPHNTANTFIYLVILGIAVHHTLKIKTKLNRLVLGPD